MIGKEIEKEGKIGVGGVCACVGEPLYGTTGAVYPYPGIRKSGRPIAETGPVRMTRRFLLIRNMCLPPSN